MFIVTEYAALKATFFKKLIQDTIRMSNSFDPDKAKHFVRPFLGLNCLHRLIADDISRQRVV